MPPEAETTEATALLCTGADCKRWVYTDDYPDEAIHWHGSEGLEAGLLVPIEDLQTYYRNPRRGDVQVIAASLRRHGQYRAIAVNIGSHTGRPHEVLAGNHTLRAAELLGWTHIARTLVDVDNETAQRIVLADNGTADVGSYDTSTLLDLLLQQQHDLEGLGYTEASIERLEAELAASTEDEEGTEDTSGRALTTGEQLALVDVSFGEPKHTVHHGQVWRVGRHRLVIAKVRDEHNLWSHLLGPDVQLVPYPEPYLTLGELGRDYPLLMVQPNNYLAGHLLDKHASVFGEDEIELLP